VSKDVFNCNCDNTGFLRVKSELHSAAWIKIEVLLVKEKLKQGVPVIIDVNATDVDAGCGGRVLPLTVGTCTFSFSWLFLTTFPVYAAEWRLKVLAWVFLVARFFLKYTISFTDAPWTFGSPWCQGAFLQHYMCRWISLSFLIYCYIMWSIDTQYCYIMWSIDTQMI